MSAGQSAFLAVGHSADFDNIFQPRLGNGETSSSISSSIPELSRAEELAIKRSSATFTPVTEGPSDNLMIDIERATGTRNTAGWDGDGIEVTGTSSNPKVDLLRPDVRERTPDSVASSGKFRINRGLGGHSDINISNIQDHADRRPTKNGTFMAKSTRDFVQSIESDPIPSTSFADIGLQGLGRNANTDKTTNRKDNTTEKNRHFLPKCLILSVALMIIIAGIVALIVKFKENKPEAQRGQINPDPITNIECPSKSFGLGEELNFTCTFDVTHKYREQLIHTKKTFLRPKDRALIGGTDDSIIHRHETFRNKTHMTFRFFITQNNATCSSAGMYDVIFQNETKKVLHTATVTFTIKPSTLSTTFTQRQLTGKNCNKTEFDATCELRNDCNNYDVTFYRNKYGNDQSLNHLMTCERNYSDAAGYTVSCSATIPDNLVEDYVRLGCKMDTIRKENNRAFQLNEQFLLPSCRIRDSCTTYIPPAIPFNCSEKSNDMIRLNSAECDFPILTSCFVTGRQIFLFNKTYRNELTCEETYVRTVCRLSWCRDYNLIVKNEIPGQAICRGQYEEPFLMPTTPKPETTISSTTGPV